MQSHSEIKDGENAPRRLSQLTHFARLSWRCCSSFLMSPLSCDHLLIKLHFPGPYARREREKLVNTPRKWGRVLRISRDLSSPRSFLWTLQSENYRDHDLSSRSRVPNCWVFRSNSTYSDGKGEEQFLDRSFTGQKWSRAIGQWSSSSTCESWHSVGKYEFSKQFSIPNGYFRYVHRGLHG